MTKKLINEALQQFTGFHIGRWSGDIRELVSSMGLKKYEWDFIKKNESPENILNEEDIKEIDLYFEEEFKIGEGK